MKSDWCRHIVRRLSTTDFGYKTVGSTEKEKLVREVFSKVARNYDVMNDAMSCGVHRLWKDEFVGMLGLNAIAKANSDYVPRHLDVAGGTGDIAFRVVAEMARNYGGKNFLTGDDSKGLPPQNRQVVVCDINPDMLAVGKDRSFKALGSNCDMVGFVEGNAECLPFEDCSFDFYTIAFGLRNVTNKDVALKEAYRVLRPSGRLLVLEFSHLEHKLLQDLYDLYSFNVIPKMGEIIASDAPSYQYLIESIRRFPKQKELEEMFRQAGFACTSYRNMTFGVVAAHSGFKI